MRFIPTQVHGLLDYATGALLVFAPWLLGFATGGPAQWVPVILGAGLILYSALTDYELGLVRMIGMPAHLGMDLVSGIFLAASPWLFGFAGLVWVPHVAVGLLEIGASLFTEKVPAAQRHVTA